MREEETVKEGEKEGLAQTKDGLETQSEEKRELRYLERVGQWSVLIENREAYSWMKMATQKSRAEVKRQFLDCRAQRECFAV